MKAVAFVVLLAIFSIECRKIVPISKNANTDFINMEMGGGARPPTPAPVRQPVPAPAPVKPQSPVSANPPPVLQPKSPVPVVTTAKPVPVPAPTVPPKVEIKPTIPKPVQPNQSDLKPVPTKPGPAGGVTTPGYGSVRQLVTFYDSKGQASVIRPYSYADAVKKQG